MALIPQAISAWLPYQNGTQANPETKRAKNAHSMVIATARLRGGLAAGFCATPNVSAPAI